MADFCMPSLGADMTEGRLIEWRVKPGDQVARGDIVAVVDTSKAEIEVEIFESGVIGELLVNEGEKVPVGTALAHVLSAGDDARPVAPEPAASARPPEPAPAVAAVAAVPPDRQRVSPLARRVAADLGVDLTTVSGTGYAGAITEADVRASAPAAVPTPPPDEDRAGAMRRTIAGLMARSKREIPHYYLGQQIDLERAVQWLAETNGPRPPGERLLPAALLVKATAMACRDHPELNGFFADGAFQPGSGVHTGIAISLRGGGLIAPAIHDADAMSLDTLMAALRDLTKRARHGQLRGSEMTDSTITVTNLGDRGVDTVFGVIYPPQVALVGFGRIRERPWASDGEVAAHPVVDATLVG